MALMISQNVLATRYYVKASATGTNNGTSWANAYTSLQSALTIAAANDEIWVAAGTYKPTTGTDRAISFVMKNDLAIYGGFAGTETLLSERNYTTNVTILSGDIGTVNDNSDNSYHVISNFNINSTAILDGFTITKGKASISGNQDGGGMYNSSSSPSIANCIFTDNNANRWGGSYI